MKAKPSLEDLTLKKKPTHFNTSKVTLLFSFKQRDSGISHKKKKKPTPYEEDIYCTCEISDAIITAWQ